MKQIHRHREQMCNCQERGDGGRMEWEFGISRCKPLYRRWINNRVLLYRIGNNTQYPVINSNRKEYEKECICVAESLCHTAEMNTL